MDIHRILSRDSSSSARTGILSLPHGEVKTPAFMPVGTNASVKAIHHKTLEDIGYGLILGNTYHLYLRPGNEIIGKAGGLHQFSGWNGNILTDSGGFQVFSLAALNKIKEEGVRFQSHIDGSRHLFTPENVVDTQVNLNSDIQMALDVCTSPEITAREAKEAQERTTRWAKRAKDQWLKARENGYLGNLFGIIQGNFYKELRKISAEQIIELDLPGIAIGGLSVGESPAVFKEYLFYTADFLPENKPRYVMGIGTPDYMLEAISAGIDIFDCVYPTRIARNGTCFSSDGMINLKNQKFQDDFSPINPGCSCQVCRRYSRSYIRHLFKTKEILGPMLTSEHNLYFLNELMNDARSSIAENRFLSFKKDFYSQFYDR